MNKSYFIFFFNLFNFHLLIIVNDNNNDNNNNIQFQNKVTKCFAEHPKMK